MDVFFVIVCCLATHPFLKPWLACFTQKQALVARKSIWVCLKTGTPFHPLVFCIIVPKISIHRLSIIVPIKTGTEGYTPYVQAHPFRCLSQKPSCSSSPPKGCFFHETLMGSTQHDRHVFPTRFSKAHHWGVIQIDVC